MLPPPSPLVRQLTNDKWEQAEASMRNPTLKEVIAGQTSTHIYKVTRDAEGRLWRETISNGVTTRKQSF